MVRNKAMRRIYRYSNGGLIELAADGSQDSYITEDMIPLTDDEIEQLTNSHLYLSEKQKLINKRSQYPKLTRYQFMRGLLVMGYRASDIEAQIMLIEDEYTRELTMLGFKDAGGFVRTDPSITVMRDMLRKTDLEIDEFWELSLKL